MSRHQLIQFSFQSRNIWPISPCQFIFKLIFDVPINFFTDIIHILNCFLLPHFFHLGKPVLSILTRMHCSRMRTARSMTVCRSCSICMPCTPPSPATHPPSCTHTPSHAPPSHTRPPSHACPPAMHTPSHAHPLPQPHMPSPPRGQTDTCKNITFTNFVCGR